MHIHTCTHTNTHARTHAHAHTRTRAHTHAHTHTVMFAVDNANNNGIYYTHRGDRGWLTSFAPKVRFSKNCIIFANYYSVHTF